MEYLELLPYSDLSDKEFLQPITVKMEKVDFDALPFVDGKFTFSIKNCAFSKLIIENKEDIDFANISIAFTDCYIKEIEVKVIQSKNISLILLSSVFSGIIQNNNLQDVTFNNCFAHYIFLLDLNQISITFTEENIFPKRWEVILEKLRMSKNKLLELKQSYNLVNCKTINIIGNENTKEKTGIYRRSYEIIPYYKIGYHLTSEDKKLLNINVSIKYDKEIFDSNVTLNTLQLNSLVLSGSINGKLKIENITTLDWYLHEFYPKGEASFYDINSKMNLGKESKVEFHQSNLDNTWFDNIDFSNYSLISFYRTKFSKTIFTSCNFPESSKNFENFISIKNIHYPDDKRSSFYKDRYEIFLQLRMALESTGNFYEAQKVSAIANGALKNIKNISKWDKSILWINGASNNHGLSIKKPLLFFLVFSIMFYVLYLWSLNRIFNSNNIDFTLVGYYFAFIDITHRKPSSNPCRACFCLSNFEVASLVS